MTPEQKQRIEQIRERLRRSELEPHAPDEWWSDIDFLLSLVKSQEEENGYWPTLLDRGDGVRDHFCIGRLIKPGEIYWEFWNKGRWTSAGEVFVGRETAQKQLDAIRANDATSMRSACVEKVEAFRDASYWSDVNRMALTKLIEELETLSIEKPKE